MTLPLCRDTYALLGIADNYGSYTNESRREPLHFESFVFNERPQPSWDVFVRSAKERKNWPSEFDAVSLQGDVPNVGDSFKADDGSYNHDNERPGHVNRLKGIGVHYSFDTSLRIDVAVNLISMRSFPVEWQQSVGRIRRHCERRLAQYTSIAPEVDAIRTPPRTSEPRRVKQRASRNVWVNGRANALFQQSCPVTPGRRGRRPDGEARTMPMCIQGSLVDKVSGAARKPSVTHEKKKQ